MGLAALPTLSSAAYADPGACSGYCWTHDPAVVKRASDGTYFRFATGGGIQVAKSTSLSGSWTFEGEALPSGSSIALSGNTDLWVSERSSLQWRNLCLLSVDGDAAMDCISHL